MRLLAMVLIAGCITSSSAHISLQGTSFEYEAPREFRVVAVGDLAAWDDVAFSAAPAVHVRGLGVVLRDAPTAIAEGPIEAGQAFQLCTGGSGDVSMRLHHNGQTTSFTVPMEAC